MVRLAADEPHADAAAADKASDQAAVAPAPTPAQVRDRLDDAFRADPIDAAWSQTAVRTLQAKLDPLLPPQSAVRSVDCRGSLCRIETSHAGVTEGATSRHPRRSARNPACMSLPQSCEEPSRQDPRFKISF